jgi:hypoxanthine phosphoribosyltransferase
MAGPPLTEHSILSASAENWRTLEAADEVCAASTAAAAVARVAAQITERLRDSHPLVLCVMRGGVVFAGQLLPQLRFPLDFDYLDVTRYGDATRGGRLTWRARPATPVAGRTLLVVDDVLDEGHTLAAVRDELMAAGARAWHCAVFAVKDIGRPRPIAADFVGVHLPDRYLFGYGMDVRGAWRNLPAVYALKEDAA